MIHIFLVSLFLLFSPPSQAHTADADSIALYLERAQKLTTNQSATGLRYAHQAREAALHSHDSASLARSYTILGIIYRYQDHYDSAMLYNTQALSIFEQRKDSMGIAEAWLNLGSVYHSRADYAMALEYYFRALQVFQTFNNTAKVARTHAGIGIVYRHKGNHEQALVHQLTALHLRENTGNNSPWAHSWRNIGGIYESQGRIDTAIACYHKALSIFEDVADTQGVAVTLSSLGSAYNRSGAYSKARAVQSRAIALYEQLDDKRGLAMLYTAIAQRFFGERNSRKSLEYATKARDIAESIGALSEQKEAYLHISEALRAQGSTDAAFVAFRRYTVLKDSIFNIQNEQIVAALQMRYEVVEKNRQLTTLRYERDINALSANNLRMMLLGATLFFCVVIGFIANSYRLRKKSEEALRQQNTTILAQREQLEQETRKTARANELLQETNTLLELTNADLVELDNEKNEFLGIAAHDLKNPLTSIMLAAELIAKFLQQNNTDKVLQSVRSITVSAKQMLHIVANLLDINRIEHHAYELDMQPIQGIELFAMAEKYVHIAAEKSITLHIDCGDTPPPLLADRSTLEQIMDNLLSNAVKYSPHDKHVFVRVREHTSTVRVEVQDQGPGISPDDMTKLFGKFARLSARPTGGEHSTGLGLSIVKKMVEAMNGKVWCESELGKGATFIVELLKA
ncbi:MAG: hypothetical protein EAZ92_01240 [Candidatus Kapaibacterium sp.]|nr:MAG: hypothetical protein EAZ92_01240 [Candidatus Kapabacteria bacterium]